MFIRVLQKMESALGADPESMWIEGPDLAAEYRYSLEYCCDGEEFFTRVNFTRGFAEYDNVVGWTGRKWISIE